MKSLKIFSSFDIRIIAIITMIIDHIGYFFYYALENNEYDILRSIGRISMPLFAFLIYQGYKHTKDLKQYIIRVLKFAIITQVLVIIVGTIINLIDNTYDINFYREPNILFSFSISLLYLVILDNIIKTNNVKKIFINILLILILFSLYIILDIEYGFIIPFFITILFLYDKIKYKKALIFSSCVLFLILFGESIMKYSLFAIISIYLYNGKKGFSNKKLFYYFYPVQYILFMIIGFMFYKI